MPPRRSACRSDLSVRPVQGRSDQSEMPNPSQESYFDIGFVRVSNPNGYRPPHPIYMKRPQLIKGNPNRFNNSYLTFPFILKPQLFQPHLLFFAHLYGVRWRSEWPANLRATLDAQAPTGSLQSSRFQVFAVFFVEPV